MISKIFESRRKLNKLIQDLRDNGALNQRHLRKVLSHRYLGYAFSSIFFVMAVFFIIVLGNAFHLCLINNSNFCYQKGPALMLIIFFIMTPVCSYCFYLSMKTFSDGEFQIIFLVTHGIRTKGRVLGAGYTGSAVTQYSCSYQFKDSKGNLVEGSYVLPIRRVWGGGGYKAGDDVVVAYNIDYPNDNIFVPNSGGMEFFNLKSSKE